MFDYWKVNKYGQKWDTFFSRCFFYILEHSVSVCLSQCSSICQCKPKNIQLHTLQCHDIRKHFLLQCLTSATLRFPQHLSKQRLPSVHSTGVFRCVVSPCSGGTSRFQSLQSDGSRLPLWMILQEHSTYLSLSFFLILQTVLDQGALKTYLWKARDCLFQMKRYWNTEHGFVCVNGASWRFFQFVCVLAVFLRR